MIVEPLTNRFDDSLRRLVNTPIPLGLLRSHIVYPYAGGRIARCALPPPI